MTRIFRFSCITLRFLLGRTSPFHLEWGDSPFLFGRGVLPFSLGVGVRLLYKVNFVLIATALFFEILMKFPTFTRIYRLANGRTSPFHLGWGAIPLLSFGIV